MQSEYTPVQKQAIQQPSSVTSEAKASIADQWMSLQDAAIATGMSMITLRRYIKRRQLKWRRLGKSTNSKIEILVTTDLLGGNTGQQESEGVDFSIPAEDVYSADLDTIELDQNSEMGPVAETVRWLQESIQAKDKKIEDLNNLLMSATYRNGYLESQVKSTEEQLKLLTKSPDAPKAPPPSWWARIKRWL